MKKNYKILAVLSLILNCVICFSPAYFNEQIWSDGLKPLRVAGRSMFSVVYTNELTRADLAFTLACIAFVFWLVCIAAILYSIICGKDYKLVGFAPCFSIVPFIVLSVYVFTIKLPWNKYIHSIYSANWMYYLSAVLQISAAVLMVISTIAKDDNHVVSHIPSQQSNNADELVRYKELLDMGVITQEEFEAKKKQLLGL